MKKHIALSLAVLALVGFSVSAKAESANDVALSIFDQSGSTNSTISVGNLITYNINIANLKTYPNGGLGAYDITVDFPSSVLSFQSATLGSGFDLIDSPFQTNSASQVELSNVSFDSAANILAAQTASFTIGTITFQAIASGTGSLTFEGLGVTSLSDEQNNSVVYSTAGAQITAVPEPSSIALMVVGAGALAVFVFRRRSQAGI
jgi:hypothetical protein